MNNTIAFGLYNQIGSRSAAYQEHIRGITNFAVGLQVVRYNHQAEKSTTLIEDIDLDRILEQASLLNTDYAYIVGYGYRSYNEQLVHDMIRHAEENNYSVLAHILEDNPQDRMNGFYCLHYQCLLINMHHWRSSGSPRFGNRETANTQLAEVIRSSGNFHDDYTPYEILPTGTQRHYEGPVREGWNLANEMLKQGYRIGNFTNEIRALKQHIYPEVGTELEQLLAGDTTVEVQEYNQKQYINLMTFQGFQNAVYVFNTDPMSKDCIHYNKTTKLDSIYCVAAGFKPIQLMDQCLWNDATQMVYFDYAEPALNFKQWLVENWDGRDYIAAIEHYKSTVNPGFNPIWFVGKDYTPEWNKTMEYFGGEAAWLDLWNRYRKLPHKFIRTNLFSDYKDLVADMKQHTGNNLIWFSNSFYTEASLRHFRSAELKALYENFMTALADNNQSLQICGLNDAGGNSWKHIGTIK